MEHVAHFYKAIESILPFLVEDIVNLEEIIELLLQKRLLSFQDREELEQQIKVSPKSALLKLLKLIPSEGYPRFTSRSLKFLEVLKRTGNKRSAKRIESCLYPTLEIENKVMTDYEVSDNVALEIAMELSKYSELLRDWVIVPAALGLSNESQSKIKLHQYYGSFTFLVHYTLNLWQREKGQEATFNDLLRVIREYLGHELAAETLVQKISPIFCYVNPVTSLKSKWWPIAYSYNYRLPKPFCERDMTLIEKMNETVSKKPTSSTQIMTISGPPGVGKSTIVLWYAKEYETKYHHIFIFSCGSMKKNLPMLAEHLVGKTKLEKMTVSEYIRICYEKLACFTCLWIYDDVEMYDSIGGIADLIPQQYPNFEIILISRKIVSDIHIFHQNFLIQQFNEIEAVNFIKKNVKDITDEKDNLIRHMCQILGYLPFALKFVITILNYGRTPLMDYIDRIRSTDSICHRTYCDFSHKCDIRDRFFPKYVKFSNNIACSILSSLAYTTSLNIPMNFLASMENKSIDEIKKGIDELGKYYFLTIDENNYCVSINPLVQMAVRHKEKEKKNENLRKIFNCEGFIEFKLIPFYFADENLQKDYANVKSLLSETIDLKKLFIAKRFAEAAKLSRLNLDANKSVLLVYNHALCLLHNFEIRQAKIFFKHLCQKSFCITSGIFNYPDVLFVKDEQHNFGVLQSKDNVYREIIAGYLLLIHMSEKNTAEAIQLLQKSAAIFECAENVIPTITKFLASNSNFVFKFNGSSNCASLTLLNEYGCSEFSNCNLDENFISTNLHELILDSVNTALNFFEYVSRSQIKKLALINMDVDLSDSFSFDEVRLKNVQIQNWKKSGWKIKTFILEDVPFVEATDMEITELSISNSVLDVDVLPESIEILRTSHCKIRTVVRCSPLSLRLNPRLHESYFICDTFFDKDGHKLKEFDISESLTKYAKKLSKLTMDCSDTQCTQLFVNVSCLISISKLYLQSCNLTLTPKVSIQPEELSLRNIKFLDQDQQQRNNVVVNEFVIFKKMTKLTLEKVGVHLKGNCSINEVRLESVEVNWKDGQWTIKKLTLINVPFIVENRLEIKEMFFEQNTIDTSCLQQRKIQSLTMRNSRHSTNHSNPDKLSIHELTIDDVEFEIKNSNGIQGNQYINLLLTRSSVQILSMNKTCFPIPLGCLKDIPSLHLRQCQILKTTYDKITPKELTLIDVKIILKKILLPDVTTNIVNKIVDFCKLQKLCLIGMRLDMPTNSLDIPELHCYGKESDYQKSQKNCTTFSPVNCTYGNMESCVFNVTAVLDNLELNTNQRIEINYIPVNNIENIDFYGKKTTTAHPEEHNEDFSVSELGALEIWNILEHHPNLEEQWKKVSIALGLSGISLGKLNDFKGGFGSLAFETLTLWREEKGETEALFNTLVEVIYKQTSNRLVYELLLKKRKTIRDAEKF